MSGYGTSDSLKYFLILSRVEVDSKEDNCLRRIHSLPQAHCDSKLVHKPTFTNDECFAKFFLLFNVPNFKCFMDNNLLYS